MGANICCVAIKGVGFEQICSEGYLRPSSVIAGTQFLSLLGIQSNYVSLEELWETSYSGFKEIPESTLIVCESTGQDPHLIAIDRHFTLDAVKDAPFLSALSHGGREVLWTMISDIVDVIGYAYCKDGTMKNLHLWNEIGKTHKFGEKLSSKRPKEEQDLWRLQKRLGFCNTKVKYKIYFAESAAESIEYEIASRLNLAKIWDSSVENVRKILSSGSAQTSQIRDLLGELDQRFPVHPLLLILRAIDDIVLGRNDSAGILARKAISTSPFDINIKLAAAYILELAGNLPEAKATLKALIKETSDSRAFFQVANLLLREGKKHTAREMLSAAIGSSGYRDCEEMLKLRMTIWEHSDEKELQFDRETLEVLRACRSDSMDSLLLDFSNSLDEKYRASVIRFLTSDENIPENASDSVDNTESLKMMSEGPGERIRYFRAFLPYIGSVSDQTMIRAFCSEYPGKGEWIMTFRSDVMKRKILMSLDVRQFIQFLSWVLESEFPYEYRFLIKERHQLLLDQSTFLPEEYILLFERWSRASRPH